MDLLQVSTGPQDMEIITGSAVRIVFFFHFELNQIVIVGLKSHQ